MFILSGPYNSPFLGKSLRNLNECVVCPNLENVHQTFRESYGINNEYEYDFDGESHKKKILMSLEDGLPWLYEHMPEHPSVMAAKLFKDKYEFRKTTDSLEGFYKITVPTYISATDKKLIAKPVSGICSQGITVLNIGEGKTIEASEENPYLIEDYIEGTEIAVDGFFDESGAAIILNIMEHMFSSQDSGFDVSDTLYWTNTELVKKHLYVRAILNDISRKYDLYNFPFHFEAKLTNNGIYVPIELNPLRFSGYGTCEIAHYAHNINPYKSFFKDKIPRWTQKFEHMHLDKGYYGFYEARMISSHEKLHSMFEEVLEYRIMPQSLVDSVKVIVLFRETNKEKLQELANTKGIV